ncbi:uncharacterized protein E0L32_010624 [Thyridium curvatum]|uniref:F-box domain-containing protein n=1 Tax=Thyridium curvatum TaxID=1093900 RepID=A0A507AS82_9PEZI|nr:uncharacterized protein E0L32_010624 [Thyridium curvatum]TPX07728.1 hypothetical protein E0L32_010624 [Thyridium curvatum]
MQSDPRESVGHPQQNLHLDHLPPELLSQIFECLVPNEPDSGETRPVAYGQLNPEESWFEVTRRQSGLRSSCLVSRQFYTLARRFLYRSISIIDEVAMVLLLRTLIEKPAYGQETRYFSCHLTLTESSTIREIRKYAKEIFRTMDQQLLLGQTHPLLKYLTTLHNRKMTMDEYDEIPQMILLCILVLIPKIDKMLLQIPLHEDDAEYRALLTHFHAVTLMNTEGREKWRGHAVPCQHLTKLVLQGDPEEMSDAEQAAKEDGEAVGVDGSRAGTYWPLLTACPAVTSVEVTIGNGDWPESSWFDQDKPLWASLPHELRNIKHLDLVDSFAAPRDVAVALSCFPQLESLYFEPKWSPENVGWEDEDDVITLDSALEKHGRSLRRLDLAWYDCSDCLISISEETILSSLPKLTNLEILYVQLALLFTEGRSYKDREVILDFSNLFPPSLVILVLEEWWWNDSMYWFPSGNLQEEHVRPEKHLQYCASLEYSLITFASICPNQLPSLKVVNFLVRLSRPWIGGGPETMEQRLANVKSAFAKNGIEFSTWQI